MLIFLAVVPLVQLCIQINILLLTLCAHYSFLIMIGEQTTNWWSSNLLAARHVTSFGVTFCATGIYFV